MVDVDYAAPNWQVRRRVYEDGVLIKTEYPGPPGGYFPMQQLMCAQAVADCVEYGFEFGPVDGVALSATFCNVRKKSTGKRRTYDIVST
jgi:hypothetical protein